jgi:hypothetical protein
MLLCDVDFLSSGAVSSPSASDLEAGGGGDDFATGFNLDPASRHTGKGPRGRAPLNNNRRPAAAAVGKQRGGGDE